MRQKDDGAASADWKPAGVHQIIFGIGRGDRRSETQKIAVRATNFFFEAWIGNFAGAEDLNFAALQPEIGWLLVGVKNIAGADDAVIEA